MGPDRPASLTLSGRAALGYTKIDTAAVRLALMPLGTGLAQSKFYFLKGSTENLEKVFWC